MGGADTATGNRIEALHVSVNQTERCIHLLNHNVTPFVPHLCVFKPWDLQAHVDVGAVADTKVIGSRSYKEGAARDMRFRGLWFWGSIEMEMGVSSSETQRSLAADLTRGGGKGRVFL